MARRRVYFSFFSYLHSSILSFMHTNIHPYLLTSQLLSIFGLHQKSLSFLSDHRYILLTAKCDGKLLSYNIHLLDHVSYKSSGSNIFILDFNQTFELVFAYTSPIKSLCLPASFMSIDLESSFCRVGKQLFFISTTK